MYTYLNGTFITTYVRFSKPTGLVQGADKGNEDGALAILDRVDAHDVRSMMDESSNMEEDVDVVMAEEEDVGQDDV